MNKIHRPYLVNQLTQGLNWLTLEWGSLGFTVEVTIRSCVDSLCNQEKAPYFIKNISAVCLNAQNTQYECSNVNETILENAALFIFSTFEGVVVTVCLIQFIFLNNSWTSACTWDRDRIHIHLQIYLFH